MSKPTLEFTSELIESFSDVFLYSRYDDPKPTPEFHRTMWDLCCSDETHVAIAAPRGHSKSTAITNAYLLAGVLFRQFDYVLLISATEALASQFLGTIKADLQDDENIKAAFEIVKFEKDKETEIVVKCKDGHRFKIEAKGAGPEKSVRGSKWGKKRPNLIICDDIENDSAVLNSEIRFKFASWFDDALIPAGSDNCVYRIVGTVLHLDSLLYGLLNSDVWASLTFRAHEKDFTDLLWPEKFSRKRLENIRKRYQEKNNLEGYSQEYLNNPIPEGETYFRKQDFLEMDNIDIERHKERRFIYFAAADLAISEKERADYTVILVAGMDENGVLHVVDARRGRWDSMQIIDEFISVQRRYSPDIFSIETEKIDKAIGPFLDREMIATGQFLNVNKITPSKSKTTRGRSIQAMMKAGAVRFDKDNDWYDDLETELMTIAPSGPRGKHDDFFDAFAYIGLTLNKYYEAPTRQEYEDELYEDEFQDSLEGASAYTGY